MVPSTKNLTFTGSRSLVPFVVTGDKFSGSITEPIPILATDDFSLTISDVGFVHGVGNRLGGLEQSVNLGGGELTTAIGFDTTKV